MDDPASPEVSPQDAHHLTRVLRLSPGELVVAADGKGASVVCAFTGAEPLLEPTGALRQVSRPDPPITIAFAPAKGDRPEWVVQKLTELGVDRIVALETERSVVRWSTERAERAMDRLARVAREAAAQSRRAWLPEIVGPQILEELAALVPGLALAERGGAPPTVERAAVAVGPEGGWGDAERALGLPSVCLGDGVLRAETAAVAAGALIAGLRSGLVGPAERAGR